MLVQLFVYLMIESYLMLMQIELLKFKMMELLLTLKEVMKSLWSLNQLSDCKLNFVNDLYPFFLLCIFFHNFTEKYTKLRINFTPIPHTSSSSPLIGNCLILFDILFTLSS